MAGHDQSETFWIAARVCDRLATGAPKIGGNLTNDGVGLDAPYGPEIQPGNGNARKNADDQCDGDHLHQRVSGASHGAVFLENATDGCHGNGRHPSQDR